MTKQGKLLYNSATERIMVRFDDGSQEDLNCGTSFDAWVDGAYKPTRIEYSWSQEDWYLVGLYAAGAIPIGLSVIFSGGRYR